ncbi:hypothetical protein [Clostridium estertheticum]|uniref:hypothetical protein n=1 Tax=Clostridium estertheticum TaxID=238834 RepID=UPI00124D3814|nr:hypothetical protein [Clostridium estertheticum]MBZ9618250.1 hypothetical protein [Clostridium estertheticum subsp. laramiense]WAG76248.1 hypothetical protein LL032_23995 [Clostridium estertheticum]
MNYNEILNYINANHLINNYYYSFCDVDFGCSFNNNYLENKFKNTIYPHIKEIKACLSTDFSIKAIVDNIFFEKIKKDLIVQKQIFIMSYCSTEKGTIRVNKYCFSDFTVFDTIKSDSILVVHNNSHDYIYITSNGSIMKNNFYKDYYMFFEHILHKKCNEKGSILIHASAISTKNGVVLFVGKKRSGKTTMLFECCKKLNCSPLAVDKVHLKLENNKIKVYGFPTRLRVLAGTLSKYNELKNIIPLQYKNASEDELWKGKSDSKVDIKIKEFEQFIDKEFINNGDLNLIILNNISKDNKKEFFFNKIKKEDTKELLENIYTPYNPEEDWWSGIGINKCEQMEHNRNYMLEYIFDNISIVSLNAKNNIVDLMKVILLNPEVNYYEIISN